MGLLRDRMEQSMRLQHLSDRTVAAYLYHMREYTRYFGIAPDRLGEDHVRQYLDYLIQERRVSWSSVNVAYSALCYFYRQVLQRSWNVKNVPRPKTEKRLPQVLSKAEVAAILNAVDEFIRRFLQHVLPDGLMKIRHYGILSSRYKKIKLARCREILGDPPPITVEETEPPVKRVCPKCGSERLIYLGEFRPDHRRIRALDPNHRPP